MAPEDRLILLEIKDRIDGIERLALELKDLGKGVPAIQKNARSILGVTHALRFGISDIVEIECAQGRGE